MLHAEIVHHVVSYFTICTANILVWWFKW